MKKGESTSWRIMNHRKATREAALINNNLVPLEV